MIRKTKSFIVQSLKILLSVSLIFWLIRSGKLDLLALKSLLAPLPATVGFVLIFFNLYLGSERWRILLRSQGLAPKTYPVFKLSMIGSFFNFAMPGGVGGDVIKAYYFNKENPGQKVIAVTSVLMDRVLGLFSMVLFALVVMIFDFEHVTKISALSTLFWFILSIFCCFVVGLSLVFSQSIKIRDFLKTLIASLPLSEKIMKIYESMHLYGNKGRRVLAVVFLSLLAQMSAVAFLYMAGELSGFSDVPAKTFFLVAPLGFMATAIPISPAGIGVGQAAFYFLFNLYTGSPSQVGPTCITAFQVGTFLFSLLGALFYLRRKDRSEAVHLDEPQI
jgi:uncharacterized protein (TIRG00374 family)